MPFFLSFHYSTYFILSLCSPLIRSDCVLLSIEFSISLLLRAQMTTIVQNFSTAKRLTTPLTHTHTHKHINATYQQPTARKNKKEERCLGRDNTLIKIGKEYGSQRSRILNRSMINPWRGGGVANEAVENNIREPIKHYLSHTTLTTPTTTLTRSYLHAPSIHHPSPITHHPLFSPHISHISHTTRQTDIHMTFSPTGVEVLFFPFFSTFTHHFRKK